MSNAPSPTQSKTATTRKLPWKSSQGSSVDVWHGKHKGREFQIKVEKGRSYRGHYNVPRWSLPPGDMGSLYVWADPGDIAHSLPKCIRVVNRGEIDVEELDKIFHKLGVKPPTEAPPPAPPPVLTEEDALRKRLKNHDWYAAMSDRMSDIHSASRDMEEIQEMMSRMDHATAQRIYREEERKIDYSKTAADLSNDVAILKDGLADLCKNPSKYFPRSVVEYVRPGRGSFKCKLPGHSEVEVTPYIEPRAPARPLDRAGFSVRVNDNTPRGCKYYPNPIQLGAQLFEIIKKESPLEQKTDQLSVVTSFLKSMTTRTGGRVVRVSTEPGPEWLVEYNNAQRLEHAGSDGGDEEAWEAYTGPLLAEVKKKLAAEFGVGILDAFIDEDGNVEVVPTSKGRATFKKSASSVSRVVATYLERLTEGDSALETDNLRRGLSPRAYQLYTLLVESCGEVDFNAEPWCKVNLASLRNQIEGQELGRDAKALFGELTEAGVWRNGTKQVYRSTP